MSPSLPWVARVSLPHSLRYSATLRLPSVLLRSLHSSLAPRYLVRFLFFVFLTARPAEGSSRTTPGLLVSRYPSSSGAGDKETAGSLQFPNYPYECMPRSQTPVVSYPLGITAVRLLPSGRCKPSAFPFTCANGYPCGPRLYLFRGSITRPALSLHPAPDLPSRERMRVHYGLGASLWSGRTCSEFLGPHRLGNIDQFPGPICMAPFPRSRIYLDASSAWLGHLSEIDRSAIQLQFLRR